MRILLDFIPLLGYYISALGGSIMKANKQAEEAKRRAAGLASTTKGRARTFKNKKKEAARKACRGKVQHD